MSGRPVTAGTMIDPTVGRLDYRHCGRSALIGQTENEIEGVQVGD